MAGKHLCVAIYLAHEQADAIVLSLVEFWKGDTTEFGSVQERGGVQVVFQPADDGPKAALTVSRNGNPLIERRVTKVTATAPSRWATPWAI